MTPPSYLALVSKLKAASKGMAGIVVVVGAAVLAGWFSNDFGPEGVRPAWASMNVNAALCMIAAAMGEPS